MTDNLLSKAKWRNYLYVEGSDDKNVFIHLLNYHQIITPDRDQRGYFKDRDDQFEIKDYDGIYNLLKALKRSTLGHRSRRITTSGLNKM